MSEVDDGESFQNKSTMEVGGSEEKQIFLMNV